MRMCVPVQIADFGLAVRLGGAEAPRLKAGTPGYMAPEVILMKPYGLVRACAHVHRQYVVHRPPGPCAAVAAWCSVCACASTALIGCALLPC